MFKKTLVATALAAGSLVALLPTAANAQYTARVAPPPPMHEVMPGDRPGFVWAPGHYEWRHGRYVWFRGHWVPERAGYVYREPRWIQRPNGEWAMVGGDWVPRRDHYAQNGRWDRDHERWDRGERWEHRDRDGDGVPNRFDRHPNDPDRR